MTSVNDVRISAGAYANHHLAKDNEILVLNAIAELFPANSFVSPLPLALLLRSYRAYFVLRRSCLQGAVVPGNV
jgi:hypothetical protein